MFERPVFSLTDSSSEILALKHVVYLVLLMEHSRIFGFQKVFAFDLIWNPSSLFSPPTANYCIIFHCLASIWCKLELRAWQGKKKQNCVLSQSLFKQDYTFGTLKLQIFF